MWALRTNIGVDNYINYKVPKAHFIYLISSCLRKQSGTPDGSSELYLRCHIALTVPYDST